MEHKQKLVDTMKNLIDGSYAHNNHIYRYLEDRAPFEEVYRMQKWNSALGELMPFDRYLAQWMDRIPENIKFVLMEHLREEEEGQHSLLWKKMMETLKARAPIGVPINFDRLYTLAYTYSSQCAKEQDVGFFLGGFFATEAMSARRSLQLYKGFLRNGVPEPELEYLKIHLEADCHHADEIGQRMILPVIEENPSMAVSILKGVEDRLSRSGRHLLWYESEYLPSSHV